jgi:hypothetical protein
MITQGVYDSLGREDSYVYDIWQGKIDIRVIASPFLTGRKTKQQEDNTLARSD